MKTSHRSKRNTGINPCTYFLYFILLITMLTACKNGKQHEITAEEIMDRFVEVSGGKDKWNRVHSSKYVWTAVTPRGSYIQVWTYYDSPDKTCIIMKWDDGNELRTIFNHGKAIETLNGKITVITDSIELEKLQLGTCPITELGYKKLGYKATFINKEMINGRACYRVKVVSPIGATSFKLYDVENGYLVMTSDLKGYKAFFTDYKSQDGYFYSTKAESVSTEGQTMNIEIRSASFNGKVNPKLFEL